MWTSSLLFGSSRFICRVYFWRVIPGRYLAENTRVKTVYSGVGQDQETALNIDGADFVNHDPLSNIRKKPDPDWSEPTWWPHSQHTSHVAPNTKDYFLRVWH